ncbi:cell wall-binding repeat-containing protein [Desulfosporosinus sp. Sb-LF]|uniref:cell wall-binding repeat-containing protein n=1 Tax=Desulfosporosinus sp. Sb-LF TaxID=2560027 RepID=UPI00107F37E2|nr:cell wall-binding repeat-containing protein [Desulfosporosinus sp. Sb-LF]TGE33805.1 cell wall-binding repeat-containing protein [Desulfosporosinus sp. Sb-LF]
MKKTKKALASLAMVGMALSMVPFNVLAAGTVPTRLAGTTAARTAVAIADQTGWTGTAILASSASYGMVDALTAAPLASYLKAPILLTGAGNTLDADTEAELTKLAVKTVYVTSGTAVISQAVLDQISKMGTTVVPLGGVDRSATSVNIAKRMTGVTKVAVANGLQDALSIAAVASAANEPILLTDKGALSASVSAYIAANPGITSSDVIGGTGVISDAVKEALPGATRHAGTSAYDTNNQVIQDFNSSLTYGNVYVANGVTGIDALAGAPLAAQTKSAIVLTDGTVPAAATFVYSKLASDSVVTALGGTAVVPETVRSGVATGVVTPPAGALSVTSVSSISSSDFKVVFNQAPADTSKVKFTVMNILTPVTVNATWNAAKTEATLTNSVNFPEGTYTVAVKNDATDLGSSTVAVVQQKIASINITSTKLGVVSTTTSGGISTQTGYATYNVLDQYGNDITAGALANSLTFQSGVGTVTAKDGLLTLDSNVQNLMQFATVVITGYDSTTGVSVSATLTTSTQIGTLSDFKLGALTNAEGKVLTDGDTSEFYASYTATDISGNPTTNYDLIKGGLILHSDNAGNGNVLTTSNSNVTATVEEDPSDSTKAVIKVIANNTSSNALTMDMPTVITAMTWTGKTSSINTTLKKASSVNTFTLMSPSNSIAVNEGKAIPFTALDQNGVALTKYVDLKTNNLTISNAKLFENTDGTASLLAGQDGNGFATDGQQVITATTTTGKYSTLTINIQKYAKADTLYLDSKILLSNMQSASNQSVDFGYNYGGFQVKDQYGRVFDMVGKAKGIAVGSAPAYNYEILATTSGAIAVSGTDKDKKDTVTKEPIAFGANGIKITAKDGLEALGGTGTVTFRLVNTLEGTVNGVIHDGTDAHPYTVIDSKSVTFSILKNTDIKDYSMDTVAKPIYADVTTSGAITKRTTAFAGNPYVYGKTGSGSKVILAGTPIIGANIDSSDFIASTVKSDGTYDVIPASGVDYQSVYVAAKTLANNMTTSSTTLNVTFRGADGLVHALTTPIKSSTEVPKALAIVAAVGTFMPGVTLNDAGDQANVSVRYLQPGTIMARMDVAGSSVGRGVLYFLTVDQYGTKAAPLAQIVEVTSTGTNLDGTSTFKLDPSTNRIAVAPHVNDTITLSGISTNGLVKTIKITVTN